MSIAEIAGQDAGVAAFAVPDLHEPSMPSEFDAEPPDSSEPDEPTGPRNEGVIVVSTAESPIHFAIRDDVEVSEGLVCLGAYLGERLIAQDARPGAVAERLVAYGSGTARLVYATAADGEGLSGYLYALLPASGLTDLLADMEEDDDGPDEPWSVSARAYEASLGGGDEDDDDDDDATPTGALVEVELVRDEAGDDEEDEEDEEADEEGDEDGDEEEDDDDALSQGAQVLVPLGAIKRVFRSHPDSVEAEAADVLANIVAGDVKTVDAQIVDQFLKGL